MTTRPKNSEENGGFWNRQLFTFMSPILKKGRIIELESEDVLKLRSTDYPSETKLEIQFALDNQHPKASSLSQAIRSTSFSSRAWSAFPFKLVHDIIQFLEPVVIAFMASLFTKLYNNEESSLIQGFMISAAILILASLKTLCLQHSFQVMVTAGEALRGGLVTLLLDKELKLTTHARAELSAGKIINLLFSDTDKVVKLYTSVHQAWSMPFQIIVALVMLVLELGPSALIAPVIILIFMPITTAISAKVFKARRQFIVRSDHRLQAVSETVQSIQAVKLLGLSDAIEHDIQNRREAELRTLRRAFVWRAVMVVIAQSLTVFVSLATFLAFTWTGGELTTAIAFESLSLFSILRFPIWMAPNFIASYLQSRIAAARLTAFLRLPEARTYASSGPLKPGVGVRVAHRSGFAWADSHDVDARDSVKTASANTLNSRQELLNQQQRGETTPDREDSISSSSFVVESTESSDVWGQDQIVMSPSTTVVDSHPTTPSSHSDVDTEGNTVDTRQATRICVTLPEMTLPTGAITAIVSRVGGGKSSALAALAGEMRPDVPEHQQHGLITTAGSCALVRQNPFILNATIRENILFGLPLKQERYERVVMACALAPDLAIFPAGDGTEVGERGVTLSGGQRAKISLARACYSGASVYLLDDPLSAVDPGILGHLWRHAIRQLMVENGGTVVMATHARQILPQCDLVMVLRSGHVQALAPPGDASLDLEGLALESPDVLEAVDLMDGPEGSSPGGDSVFGHASIAELKTDGLLLQGLEQDGQLVAEERKEVGAVKYAVLGRYASAMGGWPIVTVVVFFYLLTQFTFQLSRLWLTYWTGDGADEPITKLWGVYAVLSFAYVIMMFARHLIHMVSSLRVSKNIHGDMLTALLRAPMWFFNSTPAGRILNRFSSDLNGLDESVFAAMSSFGRCIISVLGTLIVMIYSSPSLLVITIPLLGVFWALSKAFRPGQRSIKRITTIAKSPVLAQANEMLGGLDVIRTFRSQARFQQQFASKVERQIRAVYTQMSANRWLSVRTESLATVLSAVAAAGLSAATQAQIVSPSLAALALSSSFTISQTLGWAVRQFATLETELNSVERVSEYCTDLPSEATTATAAPSDAGEWPVTPTLEVRDLTVRYHIPGSAAPPPPPALSGVSFTARAGQRVAICGQSGSGKSTLVNALFRLVEPDSGSIEFDRRDLLGMDLKSVRGAMAIVPQIPTLFSGTLAHNLDPTGVIGDAELHGALEEVGLGDLLSTRGLSSPSDLELVANGSNLSAGERQLVCLARATLRGAQLIVLDEASASVDHDTDRRVQAAIRRAFKGRTVLTIAHRLDTIIDYDMVLILSAGELVESGTPAELLRQRGMFFQMVEETGPVESARLQSLALTAEATLDTY
eukprot:gnl/Dysnectes_brevis/1598_a1809_871.p1 GENE.gnl/Dysnectes_brevis/1598_a1809_871~~gnl/Dysnectes_brevis/1598_a1809_871.p1  ORF type:complete len:1384 (-),score=325.14 gnl/Dysnectes_brevis/1598_a1809_871:263-4414(-)